MGKSYSTAEQIGVSDFAKNISGNTGDFLEEGALQISGSRFEDNQKSYTNSGFQIGESATVGNVTIDNSDFSTLSEYLKDANATAAAANAADKSFFGDLVKKFGDLINVKTSATVDDIAAEADTAGDPPRWPLFAGMAAVAVLVFWLWRKN